MADLPQPIFQKELAKRKIPVHYGVEELEQDLGFTSVSRFVGKCCCWQVNRCCRHPLLAPDSGRPIPQAASSSQVSLL
ncbi:MAG: hypothetical protein IPM98_03075 [Lewinellaceae bacterium]|nr:hypothetical protein [Lewinellaceae bacterium]